MVLWADLSWAMRGRTRETRELAFDEAEGFFGVEARHADRCAASVDRHHGGQERAVVVERPGHQRAVEAGGAEVDQGAWRAEIDDAFLMGND